MKSSLHWTNTGQHWSIHIVHKSIFFDKFPCDMVLPIDYIVLTLQQLKITRPGAVV